VIGVLHLLSPALHPQYSLLLCLLCCGCCSQSDSGLGKPMTEQELAVLRKAMGVNSYGTFVDRSAATRLLGSCSHVGAVMLASFLGCPLH
jgi:hypothetical protein